MRNETKSSDSSGIARREILRAGAWSVPVVAAAIATPLAAASTGALPLSRLMNMVNSDSPVPLSTTEWRDLIYTVANWEAPVTVGTVFLRLTGVTDLEFDYDQTATSFDAVWNSGPFTQTVDNTAWTLSINGDIATFTSMLTLEPGFSGELPHSSRIGVRVRQRAGAAPGLRILPSQVWDSVTAPDPATLVPLPVLFS